MTKSAYIIDYQALPEGAYKFSYELDNEFFAAEEKSEVLGGNVKAEAELQVTINGGKVVLRVAGKVQVTCDRCLEPMTLTIEGEEELPIRIGQEGEEDAVYLNPQKQELDLGWLLYELVLLNLPIVHSHQEGKCNPEMQELLHAHLTADENE